MKPTNRVNLDLGCFCIGAFAGLSCLGHHGIYGGEWSGNEGRLG